ncbi:hypothetical protein FRB95_006331, partial [Tulasnella sp. JGI-2019a]
SLRRTSNLPATLPSSQRPLHRLENTIKSLPLEITGPIAYHLRHDSRTLRAKLVSAVACSDAKLSVSAHRYYNREDGSLNSTAIWFDSERSGDSETAHREIHSPQAKLW